MGRCEEGRGRGRDTAAPKEVRRPRPRALTSLRHLGVDTIDLFQLHRVDPQIRLADQIGELKDLQDEGVIRHIGMSEVTAAQLEEAGRTARIVSVQNLYNLADRDAEPVLRYAERNGLAFIPWFPLATGELAKPGGPLDAIAKEHGASPSQLALAWLLRRSPAMLPIPGTSSVAHLEENIAAASVGLSDADVEALTAAVG
ncbi:MAG: aldo/keto reductase [Pseudonocardiaceae bacterium]|nr:MAG: aldo/keto reductase [Pseudonocardiaceae bacterium]